MEMFGVLDIRCNPQQPDTSVDLLHKVPAVTIQWKLRISNLPVLDGLGQWSHVLKTLDTWLSGTLCGYRG